jgi:pilus assembly protein CpaC
VGTLQQKNGAAPDRPSACARVGYFVCLGLVIGGISYGLATAQVPPVVTLPNEPAKELPKVAPAQPQPALPDIKEAKEPPVMPMPQPFGPRQFRLPQLCDTVKVVGTPPRPTPETVGRYGKFVKEFIDPEMTLDLVSNRTRLMVFKQVPKRIQIADESIAGYTLLAPTELSLLGRNVGITVLTLWFVDPQDAKKETILTYHVNVVPDPVQRERLERVYKALTDEINHAFPNSVVQLSLVGDKLVVSGHARDVAEATQILRIVRANAPFAQHNNQAPRTRDTALIPVDRQKPGREPGEANQPGLPPPGVENFELGDHHPLIVNLLRINGEQQVMLKVIVAEVNRSAARSIGMNLTATNRNGMTYFANNTGSIATGGLTATGFAFGNPALNLANGVTNGVGTALGNGGFNNLPVALDNGQIQLAISALRDLNYARSLAEPNLVALNGQTAHFHAGGQFPVSVVSGYTNYGLQGVNFVPYGVQLNFTPFITDRDRVRLQIAAEVSTRDLAAGVTVINGASVPSLSTRNFSTTVELREGQTLAVAGLIQNNLGADSKRVPFFGDLPLIGRAFSFDRVTAGEQELVILITPELVHPMCAREVPPLPGSDLFEPTDLEFYLHGRLESHYGVDYRSTIRTDWQRIHMNRRIENMYLIGPSGPGPSEVK